MTTYKTFKFDHVFKHTDSQENVYKAADIAFYVHQVIEVSFYFYLTVKGISLDNLCVRTDWIRQDVHYGGLQVPCQPTKATEHDALGTKELSS